MRALDIVGVSEAAEMLGISVVTFKNWQRSAVKPLPPADIVLKCGPIWRRSTLERWAKNNPKVRDATVLGRVA